MRRPSRRIAFYGSPTPVGHARIRIRMTFQYRAVLSPCIGVCTIDDDGLCVGCHRTGNEIAAWPMMNDDARLRMMDVVLPGRALAREST